MNSLFLLLQLFLFILRVNSQPEGWKMTDRFYGFRYELIGSDLDKSIMESIQYEADNHACFGWTQRSLSNSIVGEARCSKAKGKIFQEKIQSISPAISKADILIYEDTKIRLHFSTFKILPEDRETCFLDPPHQCGDIAARMNGDANKKDEL